MKNDGANPRPGATASDAPDAALNVDKASDIEYGGRQRTLPPWQHRLFFVVCVGYVVFHLVVLNLYPIDPWLLRVIHVCVGSVIGFAVFTPGRRPQTSVAWYDWAMIAANLAILVYIDENFDDLLFRAGVLPTIWDLVAGAAGTFMVLELTRRTAGLALPILALLFIVYSFV